MISFDEYQQMKGKASKDQFTDLEPLVVDLIDSIIKTKIPFWLVKPIDEYGIDLSKIITLQIDFISQNGGINAFYGKSDFNFKSAISSSFSFEMNSANVEMFNGIPLSSIAMTLLDTELYIAGLMGVRVI